VDDPAFFPPEVRAQTTALVCALPAQAGVPVARWSCTELVMALVSLGLVMQRKALTPVHHVSLDALQARIWILSPI
jgi:hypothetical protein